MVLFEFYEARSSYNFACKYHLSRKPASKLQNLETSSDTWPVSQPTILCYSSISLLLFQGCMEPLRPGYNYLGNNWLWLLQTQFSIIGVGVSFQCTGIAFLARGSWGAIFVCCFWLPYFYISNPAALIWYITLKVGGPIFILRFAVCWKTVLVVGVGWASKPFKNAFSCNECCFIRHKYFLLIYANCIEFKSYSEPY